MSVEIKLLTSDAYPPQRATDGSAGYDLRIVEIGHPTTDARKSFGCVIMEPGDMIIALTGIALHIKDPNVAAVIIPRSGLGKKGIVLANLVGLIDSDYQGEIKVMLWHRGDLDHSVEPQTIHSGDRIAQLVFVPVIHPELEVVTEFTPTERGAGGFGHTGNQ